MVTLAGPPFGIAVTRDSRWSFVADDNGQADVVANSGSRPRVVHTIPLPQGEGGDWLTRDGRYLLVANLADGATVVSAPLAEAGSKHAVLGTLKEPTSQDTSGGSIEVTTSPDDRFAFVSIEYSDVIAVYDLKAALANGFHRSTYIGSVPLGQAVVGMAVSPNGRWLYATSETAADGGPGGTLSVISLSKAESHPASAVITNVPAECSPVRVVVSSNGKVVWVTARESDLLLAFDATKLRTDPTDALLASVRVGESPVGLALVSNERRIVVADSNRFAAPGASSDLTVVNTAAALAHKPAVLGKIHAGSFPREETLEPNGKTLLVGNYGSNQLETVSISTLP
jgi:DNA-binding beta-propeller fold protein YncE